MKSPFRSRLLKWSKRIAFAGAALITLAALAVAIEGYRAKRAWLACKQELGATGGSVDWTALAPSPVSNDLNFLAAPPLAACFGFGDGSASARSENGDTNACQELRNRFGWAGHLPGPGDWRKGTVTGLAKWQAELRATDGGGGQRRMEQRYGLPSGAFQSTSHASDSIPAWAALRSRPPGTPAEDLRFLLDFDRSLIEAIRVAARRPVAQLHLGTEPKPETLMSDFATLKSLVYPFRASCWTELVAGNPEAALADFETMLALGSAADSQPVLIGLLVKFAQIELAVQPLWAGLAEHRWPDAQLVELEARLGRLNVVAAAQRCLRGERAFALTLLMPPSGDSDNDPAATPDPYQQLFRFWPPGARYRNQINIARAYEAVMISRLDPSGPAVRLSQTPEDQALRDQFASRSPYNLFTPLLLPAVEKTIEKAAASQATVTLARVACALERHFLANNTYPERLDALAPRFFAQLPTDPVNGGALKYRREAPDQFVLYSVALDGQDDGGEATSAKGSSKTGEIETGDWVWRSLPSMIVADGAPFTQ